MSRSILQAVVGGGLVLAMAAGLLAEHRRNDTLRETLEQLRAQRQEIAQLRGANNQLVQHIAEVVSLRQDDSELAQLQTEATALRQNQMAEMRAATEARWRAERAKLLALLARYDARHPAVIAQRAEVSKLATQLGVPDEGLVVFEMNQLDQRPAPKASARPVYPVELRRDAIPGEVVVSFMVGSNGEVLGARAAKSTQPEFEEAAVEAIKKWKFTPGQRAGLPVNTRIEMPIVFTLGDAGAAPGWF